MMCFIKIMVLDLYHKEVYFSQFTCNDTRTKDYKTAKVISSPRRSYYKIYISVICSFLITFYICSERYCYSPAPSLSVSVSCASAYSSVVSVSSVSFGLKKTDSSQFTHTRPKPSPLISN